jgi:hypothetical protein
LVKLINIFHIAFDYTKIIHLIIEVNS